MILTTLKFGRLGNQVLSIFKTFLFAKNNNIEFKNIKFEKKFYNDYPKIFKNLKPYFMDNIEIDKSFKKLYNTVSRETLKLNYQLSEKDNIQIIDGLHWIYPQSIQEFQLFGKLFIDNEYKQQIIQKYSNLFIDYSTIIGMTIRREDFVGANDGRHLLSDNEIIYLINDIEKKYYKTEKIIITTDGIEYVKKLLLTNNLLNNRICIVENIDPEDQIMILSLCDYVINNGCYYIGDRIINKNIFESTFGQIAQCMNKTYKYI